MQYLNADIYQPSVSESQARQLLFLFGLSVAIAVADRIPISSSLPISVYRLGHLPILFVSTLILLRCRQIRVRIDNPTLGLVIAWSVAMICSTCVATERMPGFVYMLRYLEYVAISILLYCLLRVVWRPSAHVILSWFLLAAAVISSITILTDLWNVTEFYSWFTSERPYVRHMGILGEANYAADKLCILLPFIFYLAGRHSRRGEWWRSCVATISSLVVMLAVFVSGSRMGGLLCVLMLGIWAVRERWFLLRLKTIATSIAAASALATLLIFVPVPPLTQATRYVTTRYGVAAAYLQTGKEEFRQVTETSLQERFDVLKVGLGMYSDHPFLGVGPGNFSLVIGKHDPAYTGVYSHNTYLSVLAELGIIGCVFFVLLCLRIGYRLLILMRLPKSDTAFYRWLCVSYLCLLCGFLFLHDLDSKYLWTLFLPLGLLGDDRSFLTANT